MIPAMGVGLILINYLLRKSQRIIPTSIGIIVMLIATPLALFLTSYAGVSAQKYAIAKTEQLVVTLDIAVEQQSQRIETLDNVPDIGGPRYINTTYYLKEPLGEIE